MNPLFKNTEVEIIPGIIKEAYDGYVLYYIDNLSEDLREMLHNRLVSICHGNDASKSTSKVFSYKETVKEFLRRCNSGIRLTDNRKKGMVGELLIHVILEAEGGYMPITPFFNMEERSFKKGYDVALINENTQELWVAEVKSGSKRKKDNDVSDTMEGLIDSSKKDLIKRLNNPKSSLWLNAINGARVAMSSSSHQKDAVIKLLEKCADNAIDKKSNSGDFNVILSGVLYNNLSEKIESIRVFEQYNRIIKDGDFRDVYIIACQKNTFNAVIEFLKSEVDSDEE